MLEPETNSTHAWIVCALVLAGLACLILTVYHSLTP